MPVLPGTIPVLALKILHPRNLFIPRQTRIVGHSGKGEDSLCCSLNVIMAEKEKKDQQRRLQDGGQISEAVFCLSALG